MQQALAEVVVAVGLVRGKTPPAVRRGCRRGRARRPGGRACAGRTIRAHGGGRWRRFRAPRDGATRGHRHKPVSDKRRGFESSRHGNSLMALGSRSRTTVPRSARLRMRPTSRQVGDVEAAVGVDPVASVQFGGQLGVVAEQRAQFALRPLVAAPSGGRGNRPSGRRCGRWRGRRAAVARIAFHSSTRPAGCVQLIQSMWSSSTNAKMPGCVRCAGSR